MRTLLLGLLWLVGLSTLAALAAGLALALDFHARAVTPFAPAELPVLVSIPAGSSATQAVELLAEAGVLAERHTALTLLRLGDGGRGIRAGDYRFARAHSPEEVLRRLRLGDVELRRLTVPEGLNRRQVAALWEREGFGPASAFLAASQRVELIADLDPEAVDLEGYLFPETYALASGDDAAVLVERMVERFRSTWERLLRERPLGPRTPREVVSLAALVEKETAQPEERPLVASVFANRLRRGMKLQCDPTVIYALEREGEFDGNLRRRDLKHPSPYNTYVHRGLPPGPIANPGRASLAAALQPADSEFLYFVATNDGYHTFSRTLREHNEAVRVHQKEYWRKRWREQAVAQP